MDTWPTEPNRESHPQTLELLRVQPGKPLIAIITCKINVGAYTHYWRGRTVQCTGPEDEPCQAGRIARWYGYLSVWAPKTSRQALFEITPPCVGAIKDHVRIYGTLRCAKATLARKTWKNNSTVTLTLEPGPFDSSKLPTEPDIQRQLEHMWEIKTTDAANSFQQATVLPDTIAMHTGNGRR